MADSTNLLIFGASARAAAFSALRAGLTPWCADLFADADLTARCPVIRVPASFYPARFVIHSKLGVPGPWMYTGGLDNYGLLVDTLSAARPLWGNLASLAWARDPVLLERVLRRQGVPCPRVRQTGLFLRKNVRWLIKPTYCTGGIGIHFHRLDKAPKRRSDTEYYYQEYVEGDSCAALYVGSDASAIFLGLTRQFVGEPWLHASPFQYCGSLGPLPLSELLHHRLNSLGQILNEGPRRTAFLQALMNVPVKAVRTTLRNGCGLRGLFGVDCILRDGIPWPVEVNPRYTASVEVLEYGAGVPALALHRAVFDENAPAVCAKPQAAGIVGKAILFARAPLVFPDDGPWSATLRAPGAVEEMPAFADIPHAGERIEARRPVLTFFARAATEAACLEQLKRIAADLDRWLFER